MKLSHCLLSIRFSRFFCVLFFDTGNFHHSLIGTGIPSRLLFVAKLLVSWWPVETWISVADSDSRYLDLLSIWGCRCWNGSWWNTPIWHSVATRPAVFCEVGAPNSSTGSPPLFIFFASLLILLGSFISLSHRSWLHMSATLQVNVKSNVLLPTHSLRRYARWPLSGQLLNVIQTDWIVLGWIELVGLIGKAKRIWAEIEFAALHPEHWIKRIKIIPFVKRKWNLYPTRGNKVNFWAIYIYNTPNWKHVWRRRNMQMVGRFSRRDSSQIRSKWCAENSSIVIDVGSC